MTGSFKRAIHATLTGEFFWWKFEVQCETMMKFLVTGWERTDALMRLRWVWCSFCRYFTKMLRLSWRRWGEEGLTCYEEANSMILYCSMDQWMHEMFSPTLKDNSSLLNTKTEGIVPKILWGLLEIKNFPKSKQCSPVYFISTAAVPSFVLFLEDNMLKKPGG